MKVLICLLGMSLSFASDYTDKEKAEILMIEWNRLKSVAQNIEPEFNVGGILDGKSYGDHELLWTLTDEFKGHEIIRIHIEKPSGNPFQISYHRGSHIVPGVNVIRRFIGPFYGSFSAHTIDKATGEYLGMQGSIYFPKDDQDIKIMKQWDITFF